MEEQQYTSSSIKIQQISDKLIPIYSQIEHLFIVLIRNQSQNLQFCQNIQSLQIKIKGKIEELKLLLNGIDQIANQNKQNQKDLTIRETNGQNTQSSQKYNQNQRQDKPLSPQIYRLFLKDEIPLLEHLLEKINSRSLDSSHPDLVHPTPSTSPPPIFLSGTLRFLYLTISYLPAPPSSSSHPSNHHHHSHQTSNSIAHLLESRLMALATWRHSIKSFCRHVIQYINDKQKCEQNGSEVAEDETAVGMFMRCSSTADKDQVVGVLKAALNDFEHVCTLIETNNCALQQQFQGISNLSSLINSKDQQHNQQQHGQSSGQYKQQEIDEVLLLNLLRQFKNVYLPILQNGNEMQSGQSNLSMTLNSPYQLLFTALNIVNKPLFNFIQQYFILLIQKIYKYNKQPSAADYHFQLCLKKLTRFDLTPTPAEQQLQAQSNTGQMPLNLQGSTTDNKFQMNRQLQQMLGLWISYGGAGQEKREGQQQKQEIIKKKERNGQDLLKIVSVFLSRVIAVADLDRDSYQVMMLSKDYKSITNISFYFNIVNQDRALELWLTKCLGFKLQLFEQTQKQKKAKDENLKEMMSSEGAYLHHIEASDHVLNRSKLLLFWSTQQHMDCLCKSKSCAQTTTVKLHLTSLSHILLLQFLHLTPYDSQIQNSKSINIPKTNENENSNTKTYQIQIKNMARNGQLNQPTVSASFYIQVLLKLFYKREIAYQETADTDYQNTEDVDMAYDDLRDTKLQKQQAYNSINACSKIDSHESSITNLTIQNQICIAMDSIFTDETFQAIMEFYGNLEKGTLSGNLLNSQTSYNISQFVLKLAIERYQQVKQSRKSRLQKARQAFSKLQELVQIL